MASSHSIATSDCTSDATRQDTLDLESLSFQIYASNDLQHLRSDWFTLEDQAMAVPTTPMNGARAGQTISQRVSKQPHWSSPDG